MVGLVVANAIDGKEGEVVMLGGDVMEVVALKSRASRTF